MGKKSPLKHTLAGVHVGCAEYEDGPTGCTVIYFEAGASCAAFLGGGSIAGRDLQGASLHDAWGEIDGLLFTGGSSWGLAAADGVVAALTEQRGGGVDFDNIPSVPTTAVYDFTGRESEIAPDAKLGRRALEHAQSGEVPRGRVGAGAHVTVGSYLGDEHAEQSGQGAETATLGKAKILVVTVVNACGDVFDRRGRPVAGSKVDIVDQLVRGAAKPKGGSNTVLTAVITDAALDRPELQRLAAIVDAGLARIIEPFHTAYDGDVVFACTTARRRLPKGYTVSDLGIVAARCAQDAVLGVF